MSFRPIALLVLGLLVLAPLAAPGDGPFGGSPARADEARGSLQIVMGEGVEGVDPPRAGTEAGRVLAANLFERLYDYHHLARPYRLEPSLAAALPEVSEDGLTWTLRLREDARFVDDPCFPDGKGRAVTAGDVAFCLRRLVDAHVDSSARWVFLDRIVGLRAFAEASARAKPDPRRDAYREADGYPPIEGLEVLDARTLRLRLPRRFPDLAHLLASTFTSIYPPEAVARYGDAVGRHPVGTGCWKVDVFVPGSSLVLSANPNARERRYPSEGRPADGREGFLEDAGRVLPLCDRVVVTFSAESAAGWNAFSKGKADVCEIAPSLAPVVLDVGARRFAAGWADRGLGLAVTPRLEVFFLAFNMKDPVLGHPAGEKGLAVRHALCLVDDASWEIEHLYRSTAERVHGPLLEEFPESDPRWVAPWSRHPRESLDDAKAAARETLAEAGFEGGEGVGPIDVEVVDHPAMRQAFQWLQAQAADVGLTLVPRYGDWATVRKRIQDGKARVWTMSWEADYPSAGTFFEVFYAPGHPDPIAGGYSDEEYDALYERALAADDAERREQLFQALQEKVAEDCPWNFRFRRLRFDAVQPWLANYRYNGLVPRFFEYCRVDVAQRNAARR